MSELAERSRKLAIDIEARSQECTQGHAFTVNEYAAVIEQALLAERKSVWEEAAKIADIICGATWTAYKMGSQRGDLHLQGESDGAALVSKELRAAAEKENGPRGGE